MHVNMLFVVARQAVGASVVVIVGEILLPRMDLEKLIFLQSTVKYYSGTSLFVQQAMKVQPKGVACSSADSRKHNHFGSN